MTVRPLHSFFHFCWVVFLTLICLTHFANAAVQRDINLEIFPDKSLIKVSETLKGDQSIAFSLPQGAIIDPALPLPENPSVDLARQSVTIAYSLLLSPTISQTSLLPDPFLSPLGGFLPYGWISELGEVPFEFNLTLVIHGQDQKAVVSGNIVSEEQKPDRYLAQFTSSGPTLEIAVLSGPFTINRLQTPTDVEIRTYLPSDSQPLSADYLRLSAQYIDTYSMEIGTYPFNQFSIVAAPFGAGLGFPAMTYIGEKVLALPFIKTSSLPHEILHNWWGNGVYTDYDNGNWAEGLTTYMADYALANALSDTAGLEKRYSWLRDYAALPKERDQAIKSFTIKTHAGSQVIGYTKTAFVFHMLENEIGTTAFQKALQIFWQKNKYRRASWPQLIEAFQTQSTQDLAPFFKAWIEGTGALEFKVSNPRKTKLATGQWSLNFDLQITGPYVPSHLPLRIRTKSGETSQLLEIKAAQQSLELILKDDPSQLILDPDFQLFRHLTPAELQPILRDIWLAEKADLLILGGATFEEDAKNLAKAMFDLAPNITSDFTPSHASVIIGSFKDIETFLHENHLAPMPSNLVETTGTAKVWTLPSQNGAVLNLIALQDQAALKNIIRPLPHYGRRGYVVFQNSKAALVGNLPPQSGITVNLP